MKDKPVVLLLAGGKSSRFWPLSEKNTYQFLGKNLVERQIESLKKNGFKDLIVVASEKVFDWLVENSSRFSDFNINYVRQKNHLKGIAGAVLSAEENFQTYYQGRSLYILNCSDIYDESLHSKMLDHYQNEISEDILIAGYQVKKYKPLNYLETEGGRITKIVENPSEKKMPSQLVKIVADLFNQPEEFLQTLNKIADKDSEADNLYEKALNSILGKQEARVVVYEGDWENLQYPWHVLSVMDYYLAQITDSQIAPSANVSSHTIFEGPVIVSEGTQIFEGVKIVGPSYIGPDSIIGNNSLIVKSMIGKNCLIGFSSEITRSYLGNSIWLHTNYIGDSILEENVHIGRGTITDNFRFDEKDVKVYIKGEELNTDRNKLGMIVGSDVRIGVNASIMPGVKIGSGSFIGPGVLLNDDLEEETYCTLKSSLIIRKNKSHPD